METAPTSDCCPRCRGPTSAALRNCQSCGHDLGAPNVRASQVTEEVAALRDRYENARKIAEAAGCLKELEEFVDLVSANSSVVVAMPAVVALQLVSDERSLYAGYEQLVRGGVRIPAAFANDSHRSVVAGSLFGSYGERIKYGALSLDQRGLSTYGHVFCRLKTVAVNARVSFLESNSYRFHKEHSLGPDCPLPLGYRADWERRALLAGIKLVNRLQRGQSRAQWEQMLLLSDGADRQNDDFIEAHIYESFTVHSIESMTAAPDIPKEERHIVKAAISKFEHMCNS